MSRTEVSKVQSITKPPRDKKRRHERLSSMQRMEIAHSIGGSKIYLDVPPNTNLLFHARPNANPAQAKDSKVEIKKMECCVIL